MVVVWDHHRYEGNGGNLTFQRGAPPGRVSIPDCGSTLGVPPGQKPPMAFAIKGVPPSKQIAVAGFPGTRFIRIRSGG